MRVFWSILVILCIGFLFQLFRRVPTYWCTLCFRGSISQYFSYQLKPDTIGFLFILSSHHILNSSTQIYYLENLTIYFWESYKLLSPSANLSIFSTYPQSSYYWILNVSVHSLLRIYVLGNIWEFFLIRLLTLLMIDSFVWCLRIWCGCL